MIGRHSFISLDSGNRNYYASCNIMNDDSLVYVYLLHPVRGSLLFTLYFDENDFAFKSRFFVPGVDKKTVDLLSKKLTEDGVDEGSEVYMNHYALLTNQNDYGYMVINRMYGKDENSLVLTGDFHIYYERWNEFSEYVYNVNTGAITTNGKELTTLEISRIETAIRNMNIK